MGGGHISDKAMTRDCGLIDLLDDAMADRGFDIQHLFAPIPPFMVGKEQLTIEQETET